MIIIIIVVAVVVWDRHSYTCYIYNNLQLVIHSTAFIMYIYTWISRHV